MKKNFHFIITVFAVVVLTVVSALGLQIALGAAWVGPGSNPPDGNVDAPLNVGTDYQYKTGELELRGGLSVKNSGGVDAIFTTDGSGLKINPASDGDTNLYITESQVSIRGSIYDIGDTIVNIGENLAVEGNSLTVNGNEVCRQDGTNCPSVSDTNNYVTGIDFNTGNGILTLNRQGLGSLTEDLDGRYLTSFTETDPQVSSVTNGKWCRGNGSAVVCDQSAPSSSDGYLPDDPATSDVDMNNKNITNINNIYVNDLYDQGTGSRIEVWDNMDFNSRDLYGIDKATVNTIDPLYNINGEKFATYVAAITGVKEETTGNINLKYQNNKCVKVIDFDEQEKGSDLWLFHKVTDFGENWENLVALLTPEGKNSVWYEVNPNEHQLLIYGEKEGRVSYRFTAPRFDHEKWPNISAEEGINGMKVEFKN